jgi:hypothetical protein
MDNDVQLSLAWTEDRQGSSAAFSGNATSIDDPTLRFETHWSRILHYDLFAPARRGSEGGVDDSANDD